MAEGHIQSYLDGIQFPATKDEIKDILEKNGAPRSMIDTVDKLQNSFSNWSDVSSSFDHYGSPFDNE